MKYLTTSLLLLLTTTGYSEVLVPVVKIQTNMGIIIMELYPDQAPKTVENFLRYTKEGFYEGTIFHRVIENFIVQAGGYTTDYTKKPTYDPIVNESKNGLRNLRGSVAMARNFDDPDSATSQFFINVNNNYSLDYQDLREELGYTVFGQVIGGMDVVDKIQAAETGSFGALRKNVPKDPIIIAKMTIEQAPPQKQPPQSSADSILIPHNKVSEESEESEGKDLAAESLEPPAAAKTDQSGNDLQKSESTPINDDQPEPSHQEEKTQANNDNKVKAEIKVPESKTKSPENKPPSKVSPANKLSQPPDAPSKPDKPELPSS
jgi:peptidyl-prolyl cis-trans isomerase B (cyclophilin B)